MTEDKNMEQLLKKAKTSPPVMTLSEVNELVRRPLRIKNREKQWYIPIGLMSVMLLMSWYVYTPEPGPAVRVPRWKSPDVKLLTFSLPAAKEIPAPVQEEVSVPKTKARQVTHMQPAVPAPKRQTPAPLTTDTLKPKNELAAKFIVVKYSEMMIPWYADREALRIYLSKLASEGITMNVLEVRYDNKTSRGLKINGNKIVYLKAELYLNNSLYKIIELTDFKELRIGWETDNAGAVRIKSLNYLDRNYMKRKL